MNNLLCHIQEHLKEYKCSLKLSFDLTTSTIIINYK